MSKEIPDNFFQSKVLGHPSGLFVLFFTEMWERFSYYGMRALLVLFLVSPAGLDGWDWPRANALALYGTYTALVYITPILGGYLADKFMGYRRAVVVGAIVMTLGHVAMAIEGIPFFLYLGITLLIVGNGFFKPNMTSIISHMYKDFPEKKDGAYTIFYMGVNAGAFLGILMCGYLGEKVGWSYGFGLAGIFMLLGMIQFQLSQSIFGSIGIKPIQTADKDQDDQLEFEGDKLNPFTLMDKILIALSALIGITWVLNDPISKINGFNLLMIDGIDYSNHFIIIGLVLFFILLISRIARYPKITRDRMLAIVFFAVMTVVFWMCFEQAGGSMNIFAKDYTNRIMSGGYFYAFNVINTIIIVVPVLIITWVLYKLVQETYSKIKLGNITLVSSFILVWGIVFWIINDNLKSTSYEIAYDTIETPVDTLSYKATPEREMRFANLLKGDGSFKIGEEKAPIDSIFYQNKWIIHEYTSLERKQDREKEQAIMDSLYAEAVLNIGNTAQAEVYYTVNKEPFVTPLSELTYSTVITEGTNVKPNEKIVAKKSKIIEPITLNVGDEIALFDIDKKGNLSYLPNEKAEKIRKMSQDNNEASSIVVSEVKSIKKDEVEIPATWFLILNSLFIIMFAPMFSKWWESKYNPSASAKYGLGLILLGIGFGALAWGSVGIVSGYETASVSIIWLVLAYLFHTLGELCLSPVALSYVSKLVPGRMIAMMFGVWYIAVAIGNKLAGLLGGQIDAITEDYSMSTFFMIFTIAPIAFGVIAILFSPIIKKLMHGVK